MDTPQFTTKGVVYSDRWNDVEQGRAEPTEYHAAMMSLVQAAIDSGLFYTTDVYKYARLHADFIPAEAWTLQYNTAVEGGVMGTELYMARSSLDFKAKREANAAALASLSVGQVFGSLSVNHKRINKCAIKAIEGNLVTFTGVIGKYGCEFKVEPRHIAHMIEKAIQREWRKA